MGRKEENKAGTREEVWMKTGKKDWRSRKEEIKRIKKSWGGSRKRETSKNRE